MRKRKGKRANNRDIWQEKECGMRKRSYPSDISDEEWDILEPLLPVEKPGGRPRKTSLREVVNAIWYVLRSGCQWRMLPHEFPPWSTVWYYFRIWRKTGVWEQIHTSLRERLRSDLGRESTPSAVIIDSQSMKTSQKGGIVAMTAERKSTVVNGIS
jgi:putative transposase